MVGLQCWVVSGVQQSSSYICLYMYTRTHTHTQDHVYIPFQLLCHCRVSQDSEWVCALCRSCCSSVVYRGVCSCSSQAPNLSHLPPFSPLVAMFVVTVCDSISDIFISFFGEENKSPFANTYMASIHKRGPRRWGGPLLLTPRACPWGGCESLSC